MARATKKANGKPGLRTLNREYVEVPLDRVKPHPRNPRRGDLEVLEESVLVNGFFGALVVQKSTGHILAGNHRWKAAQSLGMATIPVVYVDVDDAAALRILLADNRTSDLATYDDAELAAVLQEVQQALTLEGTGFTDADLEALLGEERGTMLAQSQHAFADPVHQPAKGSRWRIGPHVLWVVSVFDDWRTWLPDLQDAERDILVPFPGPFVALSTAGAGKRFILLQPDPLIAGHCADRYADQHGAESVGPEPRA